ncbi:MAG: hypothetical protein J6568_08365 [Snodgrassella sp.]|nr:hypothetical protein [Snodgrassella sp.]
MSKEKIKNLDLNYSWFKPRRYLHFDKPLTKDFNKEQNNVNLNNHFLHLIGLESTIRSKLDISSKVVAHQFLPFIQFETKTPRLQRLNDCRAVKKLPPKIRNISYASHKDSFIYSYYAYILGKKYEDRLIREELQNNILAFRKIRLDGDSSIGKSNIHFAKDAFDIIKQQESCFCLCLDIKKFFDNLNHDVLKDAWLNVLDIYSGKLPADHYAIYKSLSRYSYVKLDDALNALNISRSMLRRRKQKRAGRYVNESLISLCKHAAEFRNRISNANLIRVNYHKGIPQGSPLSGLLANIYMLEFDIASKRYLESFNAIYFRYCDDILIIIPGDNVQLLKDIQNYISQLVKSQKLQIQESKTEIVFFKKIDNHIKIVMPMLEKDNIMGMSISKKGYLQYLGMIFDGERAIIRPGSISRFYKKLHKAKKLAIKSKDKNRDDILYKHKLYSRYSHLGHRNFVSYVKRASQHFEDHRIKRQVRNHFKKI